ncbi:MAG TPA: hypothetical protein VI168_17390 [Croceibacterium sp.]
MALLQIDIQGLPTTPLDAAAEFYASELPEIRDDSDIHEQHDLVIVFDPAGDDHRAWRLAVIQELAREMAPRRVNGIVGADAFAISEAIAYLDVAPGVTGQLLSVQTG